MILWSQIKDMNLFRWFEADRPEKFPWFEEARDYFAIHQWQFFIVIGFIFFVIPLTFLLLSN